MSAEMSDADYIRILETNRDLLRRNLELEEALKHHYKDLYLGLQESLEQLRATLKDRKNLEDKLACFKDKDGKDYTEEELIRLYNIR